MISWIADLDALYFDAREGGVSYAIVDERVCNPNFQGHYGVRPRVGIEGEEWELNFSFTHYHARNRSSKEGSIEPTWGFLTQPVSFADQLWRLHLGFLDVSLAKCWAISSRLEIKPQMGLRYAEVRHKLHINYQEKEDLSFKNKYWSAGTSLGLEMSWRISEPLRFFSRGIGYFQVGRFYIHQDIGDFKFLDTYWDHKGIFEAALGLEGSFRCLTGRIGWEMHYLKGFNQLACFTDSTFISNLGDLSMQGLTLGLSLEF